MLQARVFNTQLPITPLTRKKMTEKKSFLDAIKTAQQSKTKVPSELAGKVQEVKYKPKSINTRPARKTTGRGG